MALFDIPPERATVQVRGVGKCSGLGYVIGMGGAQRGWVREGAVPPPAQLGGTGAAELVPQVPRLRDQC